MAQYKYLIVGGGMAADAAVRGIRKIDQKGSIGLFSLEKDPPYDRPPLSKGLWKGRPVERIWRKTADLGLEMHLSRKIAQIDPALHRVFDDQGVEYKYEKLLMATGGDPIRLPGAPDKIIYFRTLRDYQKLHQLTETKQNFTIIGGGFIGSEIAVALANLHKKVTILFMEVGIGGRIFPPKLATFLNEYYRERGVEVLSNQSVTSIESEGEGLVVRTKSGQEIHSDAVVAGLGIRPNVELAKQAGLAVENGIVIDEYLRSSQADIFAAGDVISFFSPVLRTRMRVEHEDNANSSGMLAGQSMAGQLSAYTQLSFFYSDIFDLGYEAVGELNPAYEIVEDWQEPFKKGVIYYLNANRVRGVLLWNVWQKVDAGRALIAEPGAIKPGDLMGRIR
jgi:3-phenylpropionate/trans-cinnamate dioxygenase ferredoxin reductase subunit